jgi:hypothetical protein
VHTLETRQHRTADLDRQAAALRSLHPELPRPLFLPWSEEPVLLLDQGRPWLYGPARRDPAAVDGRAAVPRHIARRLAAFADLDVPFGEIAIAHELDPGGPVKAFLPVLVDGPRPCSDEIARDLVGPAPPHPVLKRTARVLDRLVRNGSAATVDVVLDPIVLGVVGSERPAQGEVRMFVPLAAWRW